MQRNSFLARRGISAKSDPSPVGPFLWPLGRQQPGKQMPRAVRLHGWPAGPRCRGGHPLGAEAPLRDHFPPWQAGSEGLAPSASRDSSKGRAAGPHSHQVQDSSSGGQGLTEEAGSRHAAWGSACAPEPTGVLLDTGPVFFLWWHRVQDQARPEVTGSSFCLISLFT